MHEYLFSSVGTRYLVQDGNCFIPSNGSVCAVNPGEEDSSLWYVGVIMSVCASISSNFGVNTQKYSLINEVKRQHKQGLNRKRTYFTQPIWIAGLIMVILGSIFDVLALGFAAQSLCAAVGGFTLVANLFFASFYLGETITRNDYIGTLLIVSGVILAVAFADKSSQCFTIEDLICLYKRLDFIVYAVVAGLAILGLLAFVKYVENSDGKFRKAYPVAMATLSGLLGAQSILFAKSAVEMVKSSFAGANSFAEWQSWLIILALFVFIFSQIHWLTKALESHDAVLIVPVFQCTFTTGAIVAGAVYFGEFRYFTLLQTVFFPIGVLLTVVGVAILATHVSRSDEDILKSLDYVRSAEEAEEDEFYGIDRRVEIDRELRLSIVSMSPYTALYSELPATEDIMHKLNFPVFSHMKSRRMDRTRSVPGSFLRRPHKNSLFITSDGSHSKLSSSAESGRSRGKFQQEAKVKNGAKINGRRISKSFGSFNTGTMQEMNGVGDGKVDKKNRKQHEEVMQIKEEEEEDTNGDALART